MTTRHQEIMEEPCKLCLGIAAWYDARIGYQRWYGPTIDRGTMLSGGRAGGDDGVG